METYNFTIFATGNPKNYSFFLAQDGTTDFNLFQITGSQVAHWYNLTIEEATAKWCTDGPIFAKTYNRF